MTRNYAALAEPLAAAAIVSSVILALHGSVGDASVRSALGWSTATLVTRVVALMFGRKSKPQPQPQLASSAAPDPAIERAERAEPACQISRSGCHAVQRSRVRASQRTGRHSLHAKHA